MIIIYMAGFRMRGHIVVLNVGLHVKEECDVRNAVSMLFFLMVLALMLQKIAMEGVLSVLLTTMSLLGLGTLWVLKRNVLFLNLYVFQESSNRSGVLRSKVRQ